MHSSSSPGQNSGKDTPEASSALALLRSGLSHAQEGRYSEGVAFLALAREQLLPDMAHLATRLDIFIQDYVEYCQSQQALKQASERYIEAHVRQQAHTLSLNDLITTLLPDVKHQSATSTLRHPQPAPTESEHKDTPAAPATGDHAAYSSTVEKQEEERDTLAPLHITCFGRFEVKRADKTLTLCANRNGQAILRYLVAQSNHQASMDTLMSIFWPDDEPEVAHHKLQVATSALRRSLNSGSVASGGGYLLCKQGVYQLNPMVILQTDFGEFLKLYRAGKQQQPKGAAIPYYEAACQLYKGPFLTEDLYVDWPLIQREQLNQAYLSMCGVLAEYYLEDGSYDDAAKWASAILKENHCDEVAHRLLMRINVAAGRRSEALRQYQRCERALAEELNVAPMPETVNLFHSILSTPADVEQKQGTARKNVEVR